MRVTIVLDTGAFFPPERNDQTYIDVGYFETPGATDIEVSYDGSVAKSSFQGKLGKGNQRIEVEHLDRDGVTVKRPVKSSNSYERDILKKDDLYDATGIPVFKTAAYDCILRFNSGDFKSDDVRPRRFTEHQLSNDSPTGKDKTTRAIANVIHVDYNLADGETLRLRGPKGDLWSSASVPSGTKTVVVRLLTDHSLNSAYHKKALDHKVQHYYLPNSDPPPMDGPRGSG
jgi:hypothetical protein